jgi:hypothetical protein
MLTMHEWRSRYEIYVNRNSNLERCMSPGTVLSARPKSDYGPRSALRRKCRIPGFSRTIFRLGVANLVTVNTDPLV